MYCTQCGAARNTNDKFCSKCGTAVPAVHNQSTAPIDISHVRTDSGGDARWPCTDPQWNYDSKPKEMGWKMGLGVVLLCIAGGLGVLAMGVVRNTVAPDIGTYLGAFAIPLIVSWWGVILLQSTGAAAPVGDSPVELPSSRDTHPSEMRNLYEAFLGDKNRSYYLAKFEQFDKQGLGLRASWNWPAYLCSYAWALYRKMYGWFLAIMGISLISSVISSAGAPEIWLVTLAAYAGFSVYANSIYHGHVRKKIAIAQLTVREEPRLLAHLRYMGGVHPWVVWVFGLITVIGILAAIAIPAFNDSLQRAARQQNPNVQDFDPSTARPTGFDPSTARSIENSAAPKELQPSAPRDLLADAAPRDLLTERVVTLRDRAEQGDGEAQYELGESYYEGDGVPKDYLQAVVWYRKAAEQGHAQAQNRMGFMYHTGQGVPRDYVQAKFWFMWAANNGDTDAKRNLEYMNETGHVAR